MKRTNLLIHLMLIALLILSCGSNPKENALKEFLKSHLETVIPLMKQSNLAYWNAAVTGEDSLYNQYSQLELKIRKIYSDTADYAYLKALKNSGEIKNPLLARQLKLLLNEYLKNQIDPDLLEKRSRLMKSISC
jgi:peptidyl-dipeptidase A